MKTHILHGLGKTAGTILLGLLLSLTACSGKTNFESFTVASTDPNSEGGGDNPPPEDGNPENPPAFTYVPLLWEASRAGSSSWSAFLHGMIKNELKDMINAANDITRFCPNFEALSENQEINTWGMLFSAIVKYESAFNPLSRMQETTMGTDPVTGLPVYSEGLLQLPLSP